MARPLTAQSLGLARMRSLLVVKPSSLGDVVHTLPAVALIKRAHPQLAVRWVVRSEFLPLLVGNPDLDGTIEFPRREMRGAAGLLKLWRWSASALREPAPPDLAIDFQGLLRSGLMARRSGAREVVGLSDAREGAGMFHRWRVAVDAAGHAVDRYLQVPRALGIDCADAPRLFRLPQGELPVGVDLPGAPFVLLHPFARGEGKSLAPAQVAALCAELAPLPVVVVGQCDARQLGGALPAGVTDLLNRTSLPELIAVIRRAQFTISVDSGPTHIAAAISDRLLSIHTWSDPRKVGPYAPGAWLWKAGAVVRVRDYDPTGVDESRTTPGDADLAEIAKVAADACRR